SRSTHLNRSDIWDCNPSFWTNRQIIRLLRGSIDIQQKLVPCSNYVRLWRRNIQTWTEIQCFIMKKFVSEYLLLKWGQIVIWIRPTHRIKHVNLFITINRTESIRTLHNGSWRNSHLKRTNSVSELCSFYCRHSSFSGKRFNLANSNST